MRKKENSLNQMGYCTLTDNRIKAFSCIKSDILCSGHWHKPAVWNWNNLQIICPGSVGLSTDGILRWLLIEADEYFVNYQLKSVSYNLEEFVKMVKENNLPTIMHTGGVNLEISF